MRRRYTAEQREQLVSEVRATGDSAGKVAKRLGVNPSTAYLWVQAASAAPAFARVVRATPGLTFTGNSALVVTVGSAAIRVESGFDPGLLRAVVDALRDAP